MTLVSVVIPTYNREHTIERCVRSCLNQSFSNIEVIVVDDKSTDKTETIIQSISDKRVRYYCHDENLGGAAARNTGIHYASGKYIAFLDSDDIWYPTKIEDQLEKLESLSSKWAACYCDVERNRGHYLINLVDRLVTRKSGIEGGEEIVDDILSRKLDFGGTSTLFVRQDAINDIGGFDESFQRIQDTEFVIRLLKSWKLAYVDKVLVKKYDTGSPSIKNSVKAVEHFHQSFSKTLNARGMKKTVRKVDNFNLAKIHFSHGKFIIGLKYLRESKPAHVRDSFGLVLSVLQGVRNKRYFTLSY